MVDGKIFFWVFWRGKGGRGVGKGKGGAERVSGNGERGSGVFRSLKTQ